MAATALTLANVPCSHSQVTEISMGEFLLHSSVVWLNPLPCLGRLRKDPELTLFGKPRLTVVSLHRLRGVHNQLLLFLSVFKQAVILVYRENCKLKKRTVSLHPFSLTSHLLLKTNKSVWLLSSVGQTGSRSADLDPFRFRWLIPVSAVQVRPANITGQWPIRGRWRCAGGALAVWADCALFPGSEDPCVWELVHSRSEVEGRPETVFQLCSRYRRGLSPDSDQDCDGNVISSFRH